MSHDTRRMICLLIVLSLAVINAGVAAHPIVRATSIEVVNLDDAGSGSLRQAIAQAAPGDVITFAVTGTITLTTGELAITKTLTINGPGIDRLTISGGLAGRVFNNSSSLTINGVTIADGNVDLVSEVGGGLYNTGALTLTNVVITNSKGLQGGGLYSASGALHIANSTLSHNRADQGDGGGLFIATGQATLSGSTFTGNFAENNAGAILAGGGVTITNSTLSGNQAKAGGAMAIYGGAVQLNNATLTGNSAAKFTNGVRMIVGTLTLRNTILAQNSAPGGLSDWDCTTASGPVTITSAGYNLVGNTAGCSVAPAAGDQFGTSLNPLDPQLGPLQDNGGATQTRLPLVGSPVIDAANPAAPGSGGAACALTDQRGVQRPLDGDGNGGAVCDIGAVELLPGNVVLVSDSSPTILGQATFFTATTAQLATYQWAFGDGTSGSDNPISHTYNLSGYYTATVIATTLTATLTGTTQVTITNSAPSAKAGAAQNAQINTVVMLDGSASSDPDGHYPLAYGWVQSGGPNVVLSSRTISQPTFTAPSVPAVLTFTLTVSDACGLASAPAQTSVTIVNPLPILTSLDPISVTAGSRALTLTVSGQGFVGESVVYWNAAPRLTTYLSATQLAAAITPADVRATGTVTITVFNPAPGGGVSNALPFTLDAASYQVYLPLVVAQ